MPLTSVDRRGWQFNWIVATLTRRMMSGTKSQSCRTGLPALVQEMKKKQTKVLKTKIFSGANIIMLVSNLEAVLQCFLVSHRAEEGVPSRSLIPVVIYPVP